MLRNCKLETILFIFLSTTIQGINKTKIIKLKHNNILNKIISIFLIFNNKLKIRICIVNSAISC